VPTPPETVDLDQARFEEACRALAGVTAGYEPDVLVGIATGGAVVARSLTPHLPGEPPAVVVRLRRPATGVKERLRADRLLRRLPTRVANLLRWIEVELRERFLRPTAPEGASDVGPEVRRAIAGAERVLVVDDTVDSGRTLTAAVEIVRDAAPDTEVRTAVLTSTWRNPPVRPDYCLYDRVLLRFPWSLDS
jgi:hypoxanthine phosphoribosyltransferase